MKICVFGLWHLGTVTAACLASKGFSVVGLDSDNQVVEGLQRGKPPLLEPRLEELVKRGMKEGRLVFTADAGTAVKESDVLWVTFDTPVDEDDKADVEFVENEIRSIFPFLANGADVIISSQMPVGSTSRLEQLYREIIR